MKYILFILFLFALFAYSCGGTKKKNATLGAVETEATISVEEEEKQNFLDTTKYKILGTDHNNSVENFHVLLMGIEIQIDSLKKFTTAFRMKHCKRRCNINLLDDASVYTSFLKYPIEGAEYVRVADHFVGLSDFSFPEEVFMYPYQDAQYKKYGGNNWKKEPIK